MSQPNKKASKADDSNKVIHTYHDHANDAEEESTIQNHLTELSLYRPADQNFTARLHRLLTCADKEGISHIISWQPHGRSFLVHDKQQFEHQVMPRWFQQSSMSSFLRQLNLYGFMRLHKGPDKGGYYHELFLRGKKTLCRRIERTRIKGRGARKAVSHESEPDFYRMTPLPADPADTRSGNPPAATAQSSSVPAAAAAAPAPSLSSLEPRGPTLGDMAAQQQQESQLAAILQQMGLWQQMGGTDQGSAAPLAAFSSAATLPHISLASQRAAESQTTNPSAAGPQQLPSGIEAVDSSALHRSSLGVAHPSASLAQAQHGFLGVPAAAAANPTSSQTDNLPANLNQYAALAQALATEAGQSLLSQPSSSAQQQSFLDPSSSTNLRNATIPGFLAGLFEPTPFPQLPSHPPTQNQQQRGQLQQGELLRLGGDQAVFTNPAGGSNAAPQHQILQTRTPSSEDLSHHFAGMQPSLAVPHGLRLFPSPPAEEGKEAGRVYQPDARQNEDQTEETKQL